MPRNTIGDPPFPPVLTVDKNDPLTEDELAKILSGRPQGLSLCLRYADGPEKRGGYFFHLAHSTSGDSYTLYDFEGRPVKDFEVEFMVRFINHCTGRLYDEQSFILCQTELNFLKDE